MDLEKQVEELCERRLRADRVFEEELSRLEEILPMDPIHASLVREYISVKIASEELLKMQIELDLVGKTELDEVQKELCVRMVRERYNAENPIIGSYEEKGFAYHPSTLSIIIGQEGEEKDDSEYASGMRAELGHAIFDLVRPFRSIILFENMNLEDDYDGAVSEFYDAICDRSIEESLDSISVFYYQAIQSYFRLAEEGIDVEEMSSLASEELRSMHSNLREEESSQLPVEDELDIIYKWCLKISVSNTDHLVCFGKVIPPLLEELSYHTRLSLEESWQPLVLVGAKAMYDKEIDFSSPERFVETVKARLPKYLQDG